MYDILILKNSNVHNISFLSAVLCMKTGQIYLLRNYKPNKRLGPVWGNSNFESMTHKQLCIDITIFTPRAVLLKEKKQQLHLKVFELAHVALYHVVLDME